MEIRKKLFSELPAAQDHAETRAAQPSRVASEGIAKISDSLEDVSKATSGPEWTDQNSHDPGISMLEMFSFAADSLSYYQDAIVAESKLDTSEETSRRSEILSSAVTETDAILPKDDDSD